MICGCFVFVSSFFLLFFFCKSGISWLSLFWKKIFCFFWVGKSEQDRHSITKSSRTRVFNPQEISIFYPAQPQFSYADVLIDRLLCPKLGLRRNVRLAFSPLLSIRTRKHLSFFSRCSNQNSAWVTVLVWPSRSCPFLSDRSWFDRQSWSPRQFDR